MSRKTKKEKKNKKETTEQEIESVENEKESKKGKKAKKEKKSKKNKKSPHYYGPIEFSFNFISLVAVICVGLYFGGRSFYYYSLQNQKTRETAMTLNGLILANNKLVKDESEGLHQVEDGYYFKGNITNNYVWFANRMFRIMRLNNDDTVKLVTEDNVASFMWGEDPKYDNSNVRVWLTDIEKDKLSGVYYNTIPAPGRFLAKTKYTIDKLEESKIEKGDIELEDHVVSVSIGDYVEAGGKSSYLNNGKLYYLLGYNGADENLYVEEDGSIMSCDSMDGYGIRGVITLNKNIPISQGDGTKDNPYVVNHGSDTTYVDSYVKLGDDVWKVFEEKDGVLRMYLNGYITVDGAEVVRNFSSKSTHFNYDIDDNIGHYLYFDYFSNLSYNGYLVNNDYAYGEISEEVGYKFTNIYSSKFEGRIGMLNIFDYVSNNELFDYFRGNVGASMSTRQYAVAANGLLEEAEVTDQKHIVPVVSIYSRYIKGGNGRIDNPYFVE